MQINTHTFAEPLFLPLFRDTIISLNISVRIKFPMKSAATVLLVDDDPSQIKLYRWILERGGFAVVSALVGGSSVSLPDPERVFVDVVLLDYRLSSELSAAAVAAMARNKFPMAPIVVLSELPFMPEAAKEFADGFVQKGE